jgi:Family of unknown function (DUF6492)
VIVVDRGDIPLFRKLQSNRTTVVAKEEVLPVWVRRIDTLRIGLRSNVWVQAQGRPVRGWLLQQLVKLAVAEWLSADVLVHADSDVVLLRPFAVSSVVDSSGRVRLYARPDYIDESLPGHVSWHRSAEKLLDIEPAGLPMPDFISSLVPWKRQNALALLEHIERTTGSHWLRALAAAWDVSEYTLYGRFARDVLGTSGGQFVAASPLCADYYKHVPLTVPELTTFLDRVGEEAIAVSLTSKAGMEPEDYAEVLERQWASPVPQEPHDFAHDRRRGRDIAASRVPESVSLRPARRPPARRATVSRVGSATKKGRLINRPPRLPTSSGMAAAIVAVSVLMMVVLGLGID